MKKLKQALSSWTIDRNNRNDWMLFSFVMGTMVATPGAFSIPAGVVYLCVVAYLSYKDYKKS